MSLLHVEFRNKDKEFMTSEDLPAPPRIGEKVIIPPGAFPYEVDEVIWNLRKKIVTVILL